MDISTLLLSVIVGVVTGVAANLFTYLFVNVWLPAYRNYVYKGIRVDGDWIIFQSDKPADGESLTTKWILFATLEQKAYEISGSVTASHLEDSNPTDVINYYLDGRIFDRFLSLTLRTKDSSRIAYSTFLLEVTGDGSRMRGYRSFYGLRKGSIRSVACTWKRGTHESTKCYGMVSAQPVSPPTLQSGQKADEHVNLPASEIVNR
jgi:hypothetical protein